VRDAIAIKEVNKACAIAISGLRERRWSLCSGGHGASLYRGRLGDIGDLRDRHVVFGGGIACG
jgi:hypothetical protein